MININRRSLITGLISFVAAPAIVRAGSLMKVKVIEPMCLRKITEYTIDADQTIIRLDILYCELLIKPEWAAMVSDI